MTNNKPTLHHLDNSQSQRILWLIEELGIEYNLVAHLRNPANHPTAAYRSPPSLTSLGPYGKAPLLITGPRDGNRQIPESLAIANYLIRIFDTDDAFGLQNGDWIRDYMLTSFCMTSLGRATGMLIYLDFGILKNGTPPVADGPELRMLLGQLERELKDGPPGGYFMGEKPGRADIMLQFPVDSIKTRNLDLRKEFPALDEWLDRCYAREAWKRALGKAYGGVYDFGVFPKMKREGSSL